MTDEIHVGEYKFLGDLSNYNENSELFQLTVFTNAILQNEKSCTDLTTVYDRVYHVILNGGSDRLYDRIRMCIVNHLQSNGVKHTLVGANGFQLIVLMCPIWNDFMDAAWKINDAFFFLDKFMRRRQQRNSMEPVYDMILTVFKNFLLRTDKLLERLSCAIMQSFAVDRWGHSCAEAKLCSQIILAVSKDDREFFKTHFEDKFIDEAYQYLSSIGYTGLSVVEYVDTVNTEIESEVRRALAYGNQQTADLVANEAKTQLIANKTWFIVESNTGLWTMMAMRYTDSVTKIFNLLMRLDTGSVIMVDAINRYAEHNYYCLPINAEFIARLLGFKESMENYLQYSFANDETIKETIYFHLKCLINSNKEIPNYMSLHIGHLFENKNTEAKNMIDAIDMLKYFETNKKDMFEVNYRYHCSVRLLLNNMSDYNREITLLNEIITVFGENRSPTLQDLLEDLNKLKNN